MMKIAIISLGSKSSLLIAEEAKRYFDEVDILSVRDIETVVTDKGTEVYYLGKKLSGYDCVYCRGSYKYDLLLKAITEAFYKHCYMPIKADSFIIGHNKFLTHLELQKSNIPVPNTYLAGTIRAAKKILEQVYYPVIIKIPCGTHGKGVMYADSVGSAKSVLDALEVFNQPFIIQEYIETGSTDTRVLVVGGKVVAAMKRKAIDGDLRANIHMGGTGISVELDKEAENIALKAVECLNVDVCAVDMLDGGKGYKVIEINLSPGVEGITKATNKNVSRDIARFLYEKARDLKRTKTEGDYFEMVRDLDRKDRTIETDLDVKVRRIILPSQVTSLSELKSGDKVEIESFKGKVVVQKR